MTRRVVLPLLVSAALLGGCSGGDAPAAAPTETTRSPGATPSEPTASASADEPDPEAPAVDYGNDEDSGAVVSDPDRAADLPNATEDFRAFIAGEVRRIRSKGGDCSGQAGVRVSKLQAAGWASGGVQPADCSGYAVLWAKTDGSWRQVWSGQQLTDCTTLMRYKFPVSVAGDQCLGQNGSTIRYRG